jgi:hypothetical protein
MNQSAEIDKIAPALRAAMVRMTGVVKDSKNPHFKNDYASLEAVIETSRPVLSEGNMCAIQGVGAFDGRAIAITTRILHDSGQWIESEASIPLAKIDAQGAGSAITYGRRYALMAMLGLAPVDDDGQAASAPTAPRQAPANGLGTEKRDTGAGSIDGKDWYGCSGPGLSPAEAKRQGLDKDYDEIRDGLRGALNSDGLGEIARTYAASIATMPKAWRTILRDEADTRHAELEPKK